MDLCNDPGHPSRKDGKRKAANNCKYCSPGRICWDATHPRRLDGDPPTKLACPECTPHRFCRVRDHPRGIRGRYRAKSMCPLCSPKRFYVKLKGTAPLIMKTCKRKPWGVKKARVRILPREVRLLMNLGRIKEHRDLGLMG